MNIERLNPDQKDLVIETLVSAFHDYPVMRFVLKTTGEVYESQVRALIGFFCESRFGRNGIVLGIRDDHGYVAIALIDPAFQKPWPEKNEQLAQLSAAIGPEAFSRLELYERVSSEAEPQAPHFFLGMIGVRPDSHGKGFARALMDRVKELSKADRQSAGVCLTTETPKNVPMYEHFGYSTIAEMQIGELRSWCMFLPTLGVSA